MLHSGAAQATPDLKHHGSVGADIFAVVGADTLGIRINHLSPSETNINNQIWSIAESKLGWTFFAEEEGILAIRGNDWNLIKTPNASTVRSLAVQSTEHGERLFFGEQDDFGYVEIDSTGRSIARSMRDLVSDSLSFGNVWNVHVLESQVIFQSRNHLFVYEDGDVSVLPSDNGYHNSFVINGQYLVREFGIGLSRYLDGELVRITNDTLLAEDLIAGITEGRSSEGIIWTQNHGILRLSQSSDSIESQVEYPQELKQIASKTRLYTVKQLDSNRYVIATLGAGLLIVDREGQILKKLSRANGFPDDSQNFIHPSLNGGLWIGLDNEGATYLDSDLVRLTYGSKSGLTGYINDLEISDGRLIVATGAGIFTSTEASGVFSGPDFFYSAGSPDPNFRQIDNSPIVWNTHFFRGHMFTASEAGVRRVTFDRDKAEIEVCPIQNTDGSQLPTQAFMLFEDSANQQLYAGLGDGLGVVRVLPNHCYVDRVPLGVEDVEVRSIAIHEDLLWIGTAFHGLFAVSAPNGVIEKDPLVFRSEKMPGRNDVVVWGGRIFGFNSQSIYDVLIEEDKIQTSIVNGPVGEIGNVSVFKSTADSQGWLVTDESVFEVRLRHGQLQVVSEPSALRFQKSSTSSLIVDNSGVLWFNNGSELIRYDSRYDAPNTYKLAAQISEVRNATTGTTLFHGFFRSPNGGIALSQPDWAIPTLDFEARNLTFQFSATEYISPETVQYRYRIDGKEEGPWSEWSEEAEAITPSIDEGSYTIVVQAKDDIGRLSETASYSFVILPPWYRTAWAYMAYLVLFFGVTFSGHRYIHMRRAHKLAAEQAKELEREREVVKRLSEANDRLMQANKLKDEFLATTSHELRTPLTAILGFTSVLKDEIPEEAEYREFLDIIEDSGGRLMDTLNSLLDLAKLRAGIMEINLEPVDVYQLCFQDAVQLQNAAQKKGLKLRVRRPESPLYATADVHGLNRIMHNLVGNAVKFTDSGSVEVWFEDRGESVDIHVTDTGIGIDEEFLPELFNAFFQESDGLARSYEGTGLGLAITSGIVQLMNASIRVRSEKGQGSDFVVTLPKAEAPRSRPRRVMGMGNTASA